MRLWDGLANVLTGRGTTVDRSAHNFWTRRFANPEQIESAYLGSWLHRKIVDIPAQDMTRAGRDWDATDDQISAIEKEEKRLGYWPKLYDALTLGRLGGGAILIGLGDDPTKPLPATIRPAQIRYLSVLSRWQLTLGEMETDPESDNFGQPRYFRLSGTGRQVDIHPSRVAVFKGLPIPAIRMTSWEDNFWGMSVVEACDEAVQQATTACAGFASLIDEAKVDVFRFNKMFETLDGPDGDKQIFKRVELTNTGKSVHRAVILDKEDEWEQRQLSLAGVRDVIITYDARVAGAADIPATRLFGKSPDGMNATGEGDLSNYFQGIGAKQDMQLRPAMQKLDAVMLPSAGAPADLPWVFSTIMVLTEQQAADIELKEAQALEKIAGLALIPETALAETVQNRLIESGRFPGLKKAIDAAKAAGEELPGGDESELGIMPIGEKGGGQESAGSGGNADPNPARRAANDRKGDAPEGDPPFEDARSYNRYPAGSRRGGQFAPKGSGGFTSGLAGKPVGNAAFIKAQTGVDVGHLIREASPDGLNHASKFSKRGRTPPSKSVLTNYAKHAETAHGIRQQGQRGHGAGLRIRSEITIGKRSYTLIERVGERSGKLSFVTMWENG